ncbi:MAG: tRNA lysidine(34) synthetase TilS, partial [Acidobacteria bacterium]|nr:tRNA lysidine(34) synthetase TilS [Acidobacteriota bacterium]
MRRLAQSVLAYIRRNELLRPGDRVGIAASGGADSVALVRLMLEFQDELGIVLSLIHLNHKLRGAASDGDEEFVRRLGERHGLAIRAESRDVKALAEETKRGLEAAAREARFDFFQRALESSLDRIATAHTLDDQAETVLLKLARGAWTRGVAGIFPEIVVRRSSSAQGETAPGVRQRAFSTAALDPRPASGKPETGLFRGAGSRAGSIIRPLLGTRRSQLRRYLAELAQDWREDASNRDMRHTRNRIRHRVLPLVEMEVNPSISEVLAETAE